MQGAKQKDSLISIVIPVLDEMESLAQLALEIREVSEKNSLRTESIFVDDGSRDDSWDTIRRLASADECIRGIRLRGNFGKAAALAAGLTAASGKTFIQMDADLQDVPSEVPRYLGKLEEGYDIVNGWRLGRHDSRRRLFVDRIFNWLAGRLTGLPLNDHNCGFRCFRAEVVGGLPFPGEMYRFIPIVGHDRGYKVTEITVRHRPRRWGYSKQDGIRRRLRDLSVIARRHRLRNPTVEPIIEERIPGPSS